MLELVLAEALLSLVGEDVMIWLQSVTLRKKNGYQQLLKRKAYARQ